MMKNFWPERRQKNIELFLINLPKQKKKKKKPIMSTTLIVVLFLSSCMVVVVAARSVCVHRVCVCVQWFWFSSALAKSARICRRRDWPTLVLEYKIGSSRSDSYCLGTASSRCHCRALRTAANGCTHIYAPGRRASRWRGSSECLMQSGRRSTASRGAR